MTAPKNFMVSMSMNDLEVRYDNFVALTCENLRCEGNIIAILGHNGAGKSTLIKAVLGLLLPRRGSLQVLSTGDEESPARKLTPERDMAFCPETGSVFADISVETYVKLWCRIKKSDPNYYKKEGASVVDALHLAPLFPKLGRQLSKGQRRRVQTAIGFLIDPKLFLFDEPYDGLDVQKTHELTELIRAKSRNMAFMISSHRMDVMERLADYFVVLKEGSFLSAGTIETVCQDLCGATYLLSGLNSTPTRDTESSFVEGLKTSFPKALVEQIGSTVSITGKELTAPDIDAYLKSQSINEASVELVRSSLVDAMNYHLTN